MRVIGSFIRAGIQVDATYGETYGDDTSPVYGQYSVADGHFGQLSQTFSLYFLSIVVESYNRVIYLFI